MSPLDATIERGLAFLVRDALKWKEEHACVSCHHASMVVWSLREAKLRGHRVDEPVLAELSNWVAESGDGNVGTPRPESVPNALYEKAALFALALAIDPAPDVKMQEGVKRYLATIREDQNENGSWSSWPETRPPIFSNSDEGATIIAALALQPAAVAGDESAKHAVDRAASWLASIPVSDDAQARALRLVLWHKLGRPAEECQPLVEQIKQHQQADGGWRQTPDRPCDAWATGQALYALAVAGVPHDDTAIVRGQEFLRTTQREDGSWEMVSRPTKPDDTSKPGPIPITGAGSAWGVLGLVRSSR
ncbi:MAG: terpene cyclase/mutase family protein [Pirellulales bacterium]|nr:terpene cyclase/mutase family protein [Pirellulales bacterium]